MTAHTHYPISSYCYKMMTSSSSPSVVRSVTSAAAAAAAGLRVDGEPLPALAAGD